jgi:CHASE2 domain-containing sensor protein
MVNKPGVSTSSDGVSFTPAAGGDNYLTVQGYPYNWTRADVNGGNVLLQVNDTLEFYFVDFNHRNHSVYRATAPGIHEGGVPPSVFTYQGVVIPGTNAASLEGRFNINDTDYRNASSKGTLLYTSPVVIVEPGDQWTFTP